MGNVIELLEDGIFKEYEEKLKEELAYKKEILEHIKNENKTISEMAKDFDSFLLFSIIFKKLAPEANDEILLSVVDRIKEEGNIALYSSKLMKLLDEEIERFENVVVVENDTEKEAYILLYKEASEEDDEFFIVKTMEDIADVSRTHIKTITFAMKREKVRDIYINTFKDKGVEVYLNEPISESFAQDLKNSSKN